MHRPWLSLWMLLSLFGNLLAPLGVAAAPPEENAVSDLELLPSWFSAGISAPAPSAPDALPAWFAAENSDTASLAPYLSLPAWFSPSSRELQAANSEPRTPNSEPRTPNSEPQTPNSEPQTPSSEPPHHTIYPSAVTVIGPDAPINNCDVVTFTIVAANDAVTTTGVIITSTMPAGFTPTQVVFPVGAVGPNETITRHAVFSATCSAVSGQNVVTLTQDGFPPIVLYTDFVVNPGAITVRKEPAVIPAGLDEVVTWTVYVENTGYGNVYNVRVTDTLGSGLVYVAGVTSTSYVSLAVGQVVTFPIAARVVGCSGLENVVTATWGCNGQQCLTPQTAKGAVDLRMINPDLDFTLPAFNVPYCAGSGVFTIPITNNGEGTAYSGTLSVDLSPFSMTVAPPASYSGGAFHLPPIPPHGTYNLVFTLTLPAAVCAMPRSGGLNFDLQYYDRCGNRYTELPQSASWQLVNLPGQLSVSKSMPGEVYRGQNVNATIVLNADGIVGSIVVTDQVPAGWSVVSAAGGNVFTVGGVTYITWTLTGSATLNPVFATPDAATGCQYCGTLATNVVTATASDCQNCLQTATAQASSYLQCEEPVASTDKQVSAPVAVCSDPAYVYTNTYAFASTFNVTPTWQGMVFTDALPYQTYITGSASVWMGNGVLTCTAAFSEAVVGGRLVIHNISPTCGIAVPGATMWITYRTAVGEPSACSDRVFYDWSYLNLGVTGNAECAADGVIEEGVFVGTLAPAMTLALSGLPPWVSSCGVYTVTLTAQRTSAVPAYDAVIDVPTTTYYILDVLGFGGAAPVYTTTDALGYHWYYSNAFATAVTATIDLRVQLRCSSNTAPFAGTISYDNLCGSPCSAGGTLGAPPVIQPLPILTKFPEVIYAHGDIVTWTLIAYNSGAGPAHSVVLTDVLGSGLRYVSSFITSTLGSVVGVTPITSSNLVTWNLPVMQPKERVTIQYVAEIIGCADLTNRFAGRQGCLGQTCQSGGPVTSRVELPPTILLNTNQAVTPIETCYTRTVTVTVRNAGLLSVYSATLTETLPTGLYYISGTTQVSTDTVHWQAGPNPVVIAPYLRWGPDSGPPLDALLSRIRPGETVYLRYDVYASCPFGGGQLRIQTGYLDTCRNPYMTEASYFVMPVREADLTLIKAGQNLSRTSPSPDMIYAEPGETVVFTLTVSNASAAAPAHLVVVTDTLPGNLVFWGASPGYSGPAPGTLGGVITWTIPLINPGGSVVLTLTTVVSLPEGCTVADTYNTAEIAWGCPDGCRQSLPPVRATLRTRPVYETPIIRTDIPPATLHRCGGQITVTLNNQGPPAYNVTLTDTLPSGYVYSATVYASTPYSGPVLLDLGRTVVYTWGVLPTGLTTIVLAVRNSVGAGGCAIPFGPNVITMTYDDDIADCYNTGTYSATASADIHVVGPVLAVDKSPASLTAQVGQRITWTLRITNTGQGAAYNVVVTDVVASTFADITATSGSDGAPPVIVGNVITWTPNPIPANGTWSAQVSAVLIASGGNQNVVTATASCDTGCLATTGSDVAYVTLMQQFDKGPAIQTGTIGSLVVFTFTASLPDVENIYENVTLTDTLPTGLGYGGSVLTYTWDGDGNQGGPTTLVSATPTISPAYLESGNIVWRLGNLTGAVQVDGVITAVIQNIPSNLDGVRLTNTITMAYRDNGQPYIYTDTANADILEPLLHIGKSYVTPYGCGATLLEDNFNTGVSGWSDSGGGTWSWSQGTRIAPTGGTGIGRISRAGSTTWTDFSYSAMIRSTSTSGHFGLIFRGPVSGTNTFYRFRWGNEATDNRRLEQVVGNSIQATLAQHTAPYTPGRWYHVEIRAEGNRLLVYVDGSLVFDVTDASANALLNGNIGIYAINQTYAQFDDILVTRLGNMACTVGANDRVTYTLTISNQSRLPGYDLVITDVIPAGTSLVTYTLTTNDPTAPQVVAEPSPIPGATGVLTWGISHLTPTVPYTWGQHTALTLTVVLSVSDGITANTVLSNQAFLAYSSQPGGGPVGVERAYSGGSHSTAVRTVNGGIAKTVVFSPPPTATLGTLVTYTLIVPASPISATLYNVLVTDTVDSRLRIEAVTTGGGTGGSAVWAGQLVTATFASIPHSTQAFVTVTARISHEWPSPAGDANAGDVITNVARMSHATAPVTNSNTVSTTVGEPNLLLDKSVESSTGSLNDLDGTALLTYTIRLTNTGSSPAYSVYITDAVPAGISVTAQYGGDARSGPVVGPGVLTWTVGYISNTAPANVVLLTYTAHISQALVNAWLTNTVNVLYHSLTDTIPGVRPYTNTDSASVETAQPTVSKANEPFVLRVGDIVTYHLVFTIPAGTVWLGATLLDGLNPGLWYITDSETLTWTPPTVNVTITQRVSTTTEVPGHQIIRWYFAPITSPQDIPTVVTLTFQAQAVGLRIDTLEPVWINQTDRFWPANYVQLEFPWPDVVTDVVVNMLIQPYLEIAKDSTPPPGSYVGAGERITYTLTVTNTGYGLAYDIVISDVLPADLFYVTSTVSSATPPAIAFIAEPTPGATGVLTWRVNELWGREWNAGNPCTAVITVVAQVTDTVGANRILTNTVAIPYYDSQPGDGPGPYVPDEREYTDGSDSVWHRTVDAGILKTVAPPTATLGSVVTYVIVVPASPITATLYNVTVTDQLDSRLQLHTVSDGPDGTVVVAGNRFTVTFPAIPHGQQRLITVTAVLSDPLGAVAGDVITNVAVMEHRDGGPTPSNVVTVTVAEPRVTLDKSVQTPRDPLGAGDIVTYTLVLSNTGDWPAYDLVITDSLPAGLSFAATVGFTVTDPVTASRGGDYPAWTVSQLNVGGYVYITFTAQVAWDIGAGLTLTNSAWGRYDSQPGPVPGEREYDIPTDTVPVNTGYPALDLEKSAEPSPVEAGELLTYTLTVTNTGIVSATGVVITDAVPAYTVYQSCGPLPCGESGGVVSWSLGVLDISIPRVVTMVVRVNSPLPNGTIIPNTAWVTSTEGITDTDEITTPVGSAPILHLVKSSTDADGGDLRPGDRITYTLVVSNSGNEAASGVTVSDTVPAHTTYVPGSIAGGDSRNDSGLPTLVWTINALPPNVPVILTFAVTVNLPLTNGLQIANTGAVTCTEVPTPTTDTVTDTVTSSHSLAVSKSAWPSPVQAGDLLTYTLVYTLTGDEPVYGVVVSDTTPVHTTFYEAIPPATSDPGIGNAGPVTWNLGDFLPPESGITLATGVLTLVVRVDSPLVSGTLIYNAAAITDTSGLTDTDDVTTPVQSSHSLSVVKTAQPSPVQAGERLTYTIQWSVTGNEPAFGVTLSDTVPLSTAYVSCAGAPCGESGGVVTWSLGDQYPPASGTVTMVVRVDSPLVSGTLIYNAVAITDTSGLTDTDDVTTPVQSSHSLSVVKTAQPSPVQAGERLTYTIQWSVTGNEPAFGVTLSDTVPLSTAYVSCAGAPCGESGGVVTWSLGDQYPPASGTVTMVVRVDSSVLSGTLLYNAVAITDTSGITDTDDITTPVEGAADLGVTKADDPDPVIVGTLLTYNLVVINNGPSDARGVVVTDTLPPEVEYISANPMPVSGPNPLVWNLGDMAAGAMRYLTVTVRVRVTTTDVFTNRVVVGSDTPDDNPGNNEDEEPTTPLVPGLELTKDVAPGQAVRSMPFTYTIRITNTGQVAFDPLVLTDTLPADFYYVVGSGAPRDPDLIAEPLLVWQNLGPLAPGQSLTVSFAVTATPGITGTYWNVALVGGEYPGGILTDTDDAPIALTDPAIALDKQLVAADLDDVLPNYVTFTIVITNIGISTIDVLPLVDQYDTYYLSFVTATVVPNEPDDDGLITWYDLTGPAPHGFGRDLAPGESFRITTVFRVVYDITTTVNTALVTDPRDVYDNPANEPEDEERITDIPTAVELLYFRVGRIDNPSYVRLEWATAVEVDTFGFNLYRAPVAERARAEVVAFVPSEARGGGATYVYNDTVPYEGVWWYWLAEVDTGMRETFYGPVSAVVGTATLPYRVYLPLVLR